MSFDITNKSGTHYWALAAYGTYEELVRRYPIFKSVFPPSGLSAECAGDSKLFTKKVSAILRERMREFLRSKGITNLSKLPKQTEINHTDKIKSLFPGLSRWDAYAVNVALKVARTGGSIRVC